MNQEDSLIREANRYVESVRRYGDVVDRFVESHGQWGKKAETRRSADRFANLLWHRQSRVRKIVDEFNAQKGITVAPRTLMAWARFQRAKDRQQQSTDRLRAKSLSLSEGKALTERMAHQNRIREALSENDIREIAKELRKASDRLSNIPTWGQNADVVKYRNSVRYAMENAAQDLVPLPKTPMAYVSAEYMDRVHLIKQEPRDKVGKYAFGLKAANRRFAELPLWTKGESKRGFPKGKGVRPAINAINLTFQGHKIALICSSEYDDDLIDFPEPLTLS